MKRVTALLWDLFSGEMWLRYYPNGGGIVLFRSLQVSVELFLIALAIQAALQPESLAVGLREAAHKHLPWFGALFGACYAALYTRFSAQWTYLADLYNRLMAAEDSAPRTELRGAKRIRRMLWWLAFMEDASDLHLATKPTYATAIAMLHREPEVAAEVGRSATLCSLRARLIKTLGEPEFEQLSTGTRVAAKAPSAMLEWCRAVLAMRPSGDAQDVRSPSGALLQTGGASGPLLARDGGTRRHRSLGRTSLRNTALTAFIASAVTLILSPLSERLSFILNEYMSRPRLEIEYVEIVAELAPVALPVAELRNLATSPAMQALVMSGTAPQGMLNMSSFPDSGGLADIEEARSAVGHLGKVLRTRLSDLRSFSQVLSKQPTDRQAREVAQRFSPQTAMMMSAMTDPTVIANSLTPRISAEMETLQGALNASLRVQRLLERPLVRRPGRLLFKVSVINRGSSDGLVRNLARISPGAGEASHRLIRSAGPAMPRPHPSPTLLGVPTYVLNMPPAAQRETSVERIEKYSMAEIWYELDTKALASGELAQLWTTFEAGAPVDAALSLLSHVNASVVYRWARESDIASVRPGTRSPPHE